MHVPTRAHAASQAARLQAVKTWSSFCACTAADWENIIAHADRVQESLAEYSNQGGCLMVTRMHTQTCTKKLRGMKAPFLQSSVLFSL